MASAGFSSQKNYFNFAEGKAHCVTSSTGFATKTIEDKDKHGDVLAVDVYGKAESPSCEYKISAALAGSDFPALGTVTPVAPDGDLQLPLMLTTVEISTGAGAEVGVTLSGVGVEPGATTKRTFSLAGIGAVSPLHMAQILGSAAQVSGGNVTTANLVASAEHMVDEVTGEPIASDIWGGAMTVSLDIISSAGTKPTVTPGEGWTITVALAQKDADGDYQSWTCTLYKELTVTEPVGA